MRIIGGKYRGKNLISPDNGKVRPTSDRAREAMFNMLRSRLGHEWSELKLLDVFAGSGAFALEALSQGCGAVTLVDLDVRPLSKNVALFEAEKSRIKVINRDVLKLGTASESYDILFMDAPYKQGLSEKALLILAENGWLKNEALCLIEVEKDEELTLPQGYDLLDERRYGLAKVIVAERVF